MDKFQDNIAKEEILDYKKRGDCYTWCFPINLGDFDANEIWNNHSEINALEQGMTLYVHIPYCKFICSMCPFTHEIVEEEKLKQYIGYLKQEIKMYAKHAVCQRNKVSTVYFGGGTASMLNSGQVEEILCLLREKYVFADDCEITLECHPNTVTREYLRQLNDVGINRISFGIQSFQQKNLSALKLWQNEETNRKVIQMAGEIGFHTVAMDLMYNFPDESIEDLLADIDFACQAGVQGLSMYALDPEVRKLKTIRERQKKMQMEKDMFYTIRDRLEHHGFHQMAQPDYALPGHENRQIMDLWGAPQKLNLGFGAGAFSESFNSCSWANIHEPEKYMECLRKGQLPILMGKVWSADDAIARYMALGVRMLRIPLRPFEEHFGLKVEELYKYELEKLVDLDYVRLENTNLSITDKGRFYIDNISKTFFNLSNRGRSQYWGCHLREFMPPRLYTWDEVQKGRQ